MTLFSDDERAQLRRWARAALTEKYQRHITGSECDNIINPPIEDKNEKNDIQRKPLQETPNSDNW